MWVLKVDRQTTGGRERTVGRKWEKEGSRSALDTKAAERTSLEEGKDEEKQRIRAIVWKFTRS